MELTIWCDDTVSPFCRQRLADAVAGKHRLLPTSSGPAGLREADIAFGQLEAEMVMSVHSLRWVQMNTAGFTSFDREKVRQSLRQRGTRVTNSSAVYADACAHHVLAMMLALGRQLLPAHREQLTTHVWRRDELRRDASMLTGETVLLLGFGAIGERLAELLAPFHPRILAFRRVPHGRETVEVVDEAGLADAMGQADHVVNILPLNAGTFGIMNGGRLASMRAGATFYNVGRGDTVDQRALVAELSSGRIRAYLDVTTPEPLPADHVLWSLPNCFITPHAAGGGTGEERRQVDHFLENLRRFQLGEPLVNQVI